MSELCLIYPYGCSSRTSLAEERVGGLGSSRDVAESLSEHKACAVNKAELEASSKASASKQCHAQ